MEIISIPLAVGTKDVDWARIDLFRKRFATLWDNLKDLKLGQFGGSFAKQIDGHYEGGFDLPNQYRLKGLYVDFRHFYLKTEPIHINTFAQYIVSLTDSEGYQKFIKYEKRKLKSEFIESGWFQHKGKKLTTKELLDIWFNAELFHSDQKKTSVMLSWRSDISNDTARSMLFMAVYDMILIIRNINWSAMELSAGNMKLRMPENYGNSASAILGTV